MASSNVLSCIFLFVALLVTTSFAMCPQACNCTDDFYGRPQVICARGGLFDNIPVAQMDNNIWRLVVSAPADNLNTLAISRIFYKFTVLREIHITNSLLPAIGEGSFKGLVHLKVLNLTDNNITQLLENNFQNLGQLESLHLDRNNIRHLPSAAFHNLPNLTRLTISRNRIPLLVPRLFLNLTKLEVLDFQGNPLERNVDAEIFKDVSHLKVLNASECLQTLFNSMLLRYLPLLEVLDISHNRLQYFSIFDAHDAPRLKELYLHGNRISSITDNTFGGLDLHVLTLGHNHLQYLRRESFINVTIRELDLSYNHVLITDPNLLTHVADKLLSLYIGGNRITQTVLGQMLPNLPYLQSLGMGGLGFEEIHPHLLQFPDSLRSLNMSNNALTRLPARILVKPRYLQMLDLSRNLLRGLDKDLLDRFDYMKQLRTIYLQDNPWSCDLCHIPAMMSWLNNSRQFNRACRPHGNPHDPRLCLRCASPPELTGQIFQLLDNSLLGGCHGEGPQKSVAFHRSSIGLMVICVLILLLLITVVLVLFMYYRRGADYYTHEEERNDRDATYENAGVDDETGDLLNDSNKKTSRAGLLSPSNANAHADGNGHVRPPPLPPPPPPPQHHHHHHHHHHQHYPYSDTSRDNGCLGDDQC